MNPIRIRFTMRQMMAAVVVAGWIAFNIRLVAGIEEDFTPRNWERAVFFRILACVVSPIMGGMVACGIWRLSPPPVEDLVRALLRGLFAGAMAGMLAWFSALILLGIGYRSDGQPLRSAIFLRDSITLGAVGAAFNIIPGMVVGGILWWSRPPDDRGGGMEFQDG
jgi:hypothetical protein